MSRRSLLLSGALGLALNAGLSTLCVLAVTRRWLPILFAGPLITWGLFGFLGLFSIAEIPLMIVGLRKMLSGSPPSQRLRSLVIATHGVFVFFAAVYAAPQFLLTGALGLGLALSALGLARWATALVFLKATVRE